VKKSAIHITIRKNSHPFVYSYTQFVIIIPFVKIRNHSYIRNTIRNHKTMTPTKITVETTIKADAKKVWDYYTNPTHIVNWNFAHPSWCCPKAENDMRVGGRYCARMEAKDGSFGFDFEAIYSELVMGEKFTYGMPDDRQVSVSFKNNNGKYEILPLYLMRKMKTQSKCKKVVGKRYWIILKVMWREIRIKK
jgi:uncharacterized protein YndB with AHSA1/START domain